MSTPVRSLDLVPETANDLAALRTEVNRILARLQAGGLQLGGLRLDTQRTVAPTVAPPAGAPNVVLVNLSGVITAYVWDGSAWQVIGTQT